MTNGTIDLEGRVAIITGAGRGLGRAHALLLAARGAKVLVNDLGLSQAQAVADEIVAANGTAIAFAGSVSDFDTVRGMVERTISEWSRIDILVNNAGILRDRSFANMDLSDFRLVIDVHLMGSVYCTKAVWGYMCKQHYGRIIMTTSSTGLYGNFGQSNYGAAKMALVGLMQTLALEGARNNICVNCIAPTAATRMLDGILLPPELDLLRPDRVSPAVLALVRDDAPTRTILCAGAGSFETANITLTHGIHLDDGPDIAERIVRGWEEITNRAAEVVPEAAERQGRIELEKAGYLRGATGP